MKATIVQCNCGAEYRRTEEKFLVPHTGDAVCTVCGADLYGRPLRMYERLVVEGDDAGASDAEAVDAPETAESATEGVPEDAPVAEEDAAPEEHRFVEFSSDLTLWVLFYGPRR